MIRQHLFIPGFRGGGREILFISCLKRSKNQEDRYNLRFVGLSFRFTF